MKKISVPLLVIPLFSLTNLAFTDQSTLCQQLAKTSYSDVSITKAEYHLSDSNSAQSDNNSAFTGTSAGTGNLPTHCLVEGAIKPRIGVDGKSYAIRFQLRLPENWNGNFLFQGGGGMDGVLNAAIGKLSPRDSTGTPALNRGYAVVSTDSGHNSEAEGNHIANFAVDQQARIDYAYGSIGEVTETAKKLIALFYQKPPAHSFFMGCSNGGRSALVAAQRYPTQFDGIIAGNPGFRLSRAAIAQAWDTRILSAIAPQDDKGNPILSLSLTEADLALLSGAIIKKCDANDNLVDGIVNNMNDCPFDPSELQCTSTNDKNCLTPDKVNALKAVFETGAVNSKGEQLYSSWPWDPGIASPGWRSWKIGTSPNASSNALNATLTPESLGYYFMTPPVTNLSLSDVDFDNIAELTAATAAINDTTTTLYSSFIANGGKMIVYHGNADPVFSGNDLRQYWQKLAKDNGGEQQLADWARLFIVPGMAHCGGGIAMNDFDALTALEQWVNDKQAPETIAASGRDFPGREGILCPYPKTAYYVDGDIKKATSFICK